MKASYTGDLSELVGVAATEKDANVIYKDHGVFDLEDDADKVIHARLNYDYKDELLKAIMACKAVGIQNRTGSIGKAGFLENRNPIFLKKKVQQESFTFGFRPPSPFKREFCCTPAKANRDEDLYKLLKKLAIQLEEVYKKHSPEAYALQKEYVSTIKPIWRIADTIFTSGIVNMNYNINYHYDAANWKDVHSAMLVLSGGHEGGRLILPKYKAGLELKDKSVLIFNGSKILHGVTPLKIPEGGHRISIVFYAMKNLCKCGTHEEEAKKYKDMANKIALSRTKVKN